MRRPRVAAVALVWGALVSARPAPAASDPLHGLASPAPGVLRLFLVRHGEAFSNLAHPPTAEAGDLDRLTERGHVQARETAGALAGRDIELVLVSPARRARETTDEIVARLGTLPVQTEDRLGPLRLGRAPDGHHLSWDERENDWRAGRDPEPTHGESLAQLGARVGALVEDLAHAAPGEHGPRAILLITHSEVVAALLGVIRHRLPLHATMEGVRNASITVVDVSPDGHARLVTQDRVAWR